MTLLVGSDSKLLILAFVLDVAIAFVFDFKAFCNNFDCFFLFDKCDPLLLN